MQTPLQGALPWTLRLFSPRCGRCSGIGRGLCGRSSVRSGRQPRCSLRGRAWLLVTPPTALGWRWMPWWGLVWLCGRVGVGRCGGRAGRRVWMLRVWRWGLGLLWLLWRRWWLRSGRYGTRAVRRIGWRLVRLWLLCGLVSVRVRGSRRGHKSHTTGAEHQGSATRGAMLRLCGRLGAWGWSLGMNTRMMRWWSCAGL